MDPISRIYNQKAQIERNMGSMEIVLVNLHSSEDSATTKIAPMSGLESRSLTGIIKAMDQKAVIRKASRHFDSAIRKNLFDANEKKR